MSTIQNLCGMNAADFQKEIDGKKTDLFILKNAKGFEVAITNYGGALVAIMVPDKDGNVANVIQGHDNIDEVITSPEPYLSTLIGRYGNRICKGKFTLDGKEYNLAINNGPNALHGGPTGFHKRVWDAKPLGENKLQLNYVAADMEEGFPGQFAIEVVYTWTDNCELVIDYKGTTDKKTIVNMTHHGYFSIAGIANPTPTIEDLICEINADYYVPIDDTSIPLGSIDPVDGTPFDFRKPKPVGKDIDADDVQTKNGAGYDHCFVLNKKEPGELSFSPPGLVPGGRAAAPSAALRPRPAPLPGGPGGGRGAAGKLVRDEGSGEAGPRLPRGADGGHPLRREPGTGADLDQRQGEHALYLRPVRNEGGPEGISGNRPLVQSPWGLPAGGLLREIPLLRGGTRRRLHPARQRGGGGDPGHFRRLCRCFSGRSMIY